MAKRQWKEVDVGDGDVVYECPECGFVLFLMDGTPEENEYYHCPRCGQGLTGYGTNDVDDDPKEAVLRASFIMTEIQAKIFEDSAENYAKQHIIKQMAHAISENDLVKMDKYENPCFSKGTTIYTGTIRVLPPESKRGEG